MQPDALGLALATSVLAVVIAAFGLVSRVVSGAVAGLSYAFGLAVARGIAEWATCESTAHAVPTRGPGDAPPGTGGDRDEAGDDALDASAVVLARVIGGRHATPHRPSHRGPSGPSACLPSGATIS